MINIIAYLALPLVPLQSEKLRVTSIVSHTDSLCLCACMDLADDGQWLQQQISGSSATQVLSQASALLCKMKKCVSRCQSIPASILSELRSLKKEMFQAHCFCGVHAMEM